MKIKWILRIWYCRNITGDILQYYVVVLLMQDKYIPVFKEDRFQPPMPSECWEMLEKWKLKYLEILLTLTD